MLLYRINWRVSHWNSLTNTGVAVVQQLSGHLDRIFFFFFRNRQKQVQGVKHKERQRYTLPSIYCCHSLWPKMFRRENISLNTPPNPPVLWSLIFLLSFPSHLTSQYSVIEGPTAPINPLQSWGLLALNCLCHHPQGSSWEKWSDCSPSCHAIAQLSHFCTADKPWHPHLSSAIHLIAHRNIPNPLSSFRWGSFVEQIN